MARGASTSPPSSPRPASPTPPAPSAPPAIASDETPAAREAALEQTPPGGFEDGRRPVPLDPTPAAVLLAPGGWAFLTPPAAPGTDVARRYPDDTALAAPLVTLVDDPTVS